MSSRRAVLAGLLLLPPLVACSRGEESPRPNVVVWLVDTLRADHLGCYGYARPTSPRLDALAASGVVFEEAHVHCNWTVPSVTSLLSGRYPPLAYQAFAEKVPDDLDMAAEVFRAEGYRTAGVTMTLATMGAYGFDQGFESYEEPNGAGSEGGERGAGVLVERALATVDRLDEDVPFFLYLHSLEPHEPYVAHPPAHDFTRPYEGALLEDRALRRARDGELVFDARDREHLVDLYDSEIAANDAALGALVDGLAARGRLDDTLLVVVSDHGEELFDRGDVGHSHLNVHRELTHVPLVLHWPAGLRAGRRFADLMPAVDLLPTLVDLCGLLPLADADGRSVAAALTADGGDLDDVREKPGRVVSERAFPAENVVALRTKTHLYIHDLTSGEPKEARYGGRTGVADVSALFDLRADPREEDDLAARRPKLVERMRALVDQWVRFRARRVAPLRLRASVELDDETRDRLGQMGYLK